MNAEAKRRITMGLFKLRNNTKTILFVDSIGLRMNPAKSENDFVLIDEARVNSDPQLAKCILTGMISKCPMDEEFPKEKIEKIGKKQKDGDEIEGRITQTVKKNISSSKDKKQKQQKKYFYDNVVEPKNTDPVVFAGKDADGNYKVDKAPTLNQSSLPMPDFIKKEDITDLNMDDLDDEHQGEDDIVYANQK